MNSEWEIFFSPIKGYCKADICYPWTDLMMYVSSLSALFSTPFSPIPDGTTLVTISVQDYNLNIRNTTNYISCGAGLFNIMVFTISSEGTH